MRKFRRVTALLAAVAILALAVPQVAFAYSQSKLDKCLQIIQLAREIGLPDSDPIIQRASEVYWKEYNGQSYGTTTVPYYGTPAPTNYSTSYNFNSYNYYSGVLDVYDSGTESDAVILARIMHYYAHAYTDKRVLAAVGWAVLNSVDSYGGTASIASVAGNFQYNSNESTTNDAGQSLLPLARDVIFRWRAGKAGIVNNGRVLPSDYAWVWRDGNTVYVRRGSLNGENWNYSQESPY